MTRLMFPFYRQRDAMDCGPACLMMVAAAHGRRYPLPWLRERSYLSREGVSALGIMEAAEAIGLRTMTVKVTYDQPQGQASLLKAPLPCVAHWNQNHFIVVYKTNKRHVWVADPAVGKFKIPRANFEKSWCSDAGQGVLVLFDPTPVFYAHETPGQTSPAGLSQIFAYVRPFRRLIIQLIIGLSLGSVLQLIFPFLTQSIVDFGIENRNIGFIHVILAAQLMLFFSQMTVQFVQSRILLFIGARINVAMVSDFLSKIMRLPIGFFDTKMTGDLMQRIDDQTRIEIFLTQSLLSILFSVVNFVVFSFVLLNYNLSIFAVFCAGAVLYIIWILFFLRRRKEIDYLRFQQAGENSNTLIELIQGMQEIKLQGSERKRRWLWAGIQARLFHINQMSLSLSQWQDAGAGFINQSKNILISFLAAKAVIEGQMTLGMMLAAQYMIGQLDGPLNQFIAFIRSAQDAKISLERLGEIQNQADEDSLTTKSGAGSSMDATLGKKLNADVQFENVSFRYNPLTEYVLRDIYLSIPTGKVTAIVGTSGSGKTTLLKLLLGFYQPEKGAIRIGKTGLQSFTPSVWRQHCGAVMQDGFVFSDTIANNITECDEYPDHARLQHAVEVANIRDFIEELPLGYNTMIGARGNGISQGQRQRLLIARTVYKNPDFIFFDEATNALDANNERAIVENLQDWFSSGTQNYAPSLGKNGKNHGGVAPPPPSGEAGRGHLGEVGRGLKTVVVVAHRLSTVRHADQIVVLEKGSIVETGTHETLVQQQGAYYHLVKNQLELGG